MVYRDMRKEEMIAVCDSRAVPDPMGIVAGWMKGETPRRWSAVPGPIPGGAVGGDTMPTTTYTSGNIKEVAAGSGEPVAHKRNAVLCGEVRGIKVKILPPLFKGDLATVEVGDGLHICGCCEWKKRAVIKKVAEMLQWYLDQERVTGESNEETHKEENKKERAEESQTETKKENLIAKRNRAIKKVLSKEFGRENVRVRGERGTAYGWVNVTVTIPANFRITDGGYYTQEAKEAMNQTQRRVIEILKREGLWEQLGIYYDDMPDASERREITIDVKFREVC